MLPKARDYEPGELVPGTVYEVVRCLGGGGMGTVYEVEDTSIGKRYVLKTLQPQLGTREDLARRMQNEARTLARLNHANIVDVITAGVTADEPRRPYYVMERLNGQSVRLVLQKKWQLDLGHAYHIAIDLLDALDHAHDKGVIHRDVKPDNIFLHRTSAGVTITKLLDFGIMSLLDSASRETAGRFVGTLRYAAPEQLRGERPTPKMDLYAAGLVLYEMIAGRGPFDDEGDAHGIAAAHLQKMPTPLSRYAHVPRELDTLLYAVLAKDPEARPRDAFSLAASLRNLKRALGAPQARGSNERRPPPQRPERRSSPRVTVPGMSPPTLGMFAGLPEAVPMEAVEAAPVPSNREAPTGSPVARTSRLAAQGTESFLGGTLPATAYAGMLEPTPPPIALPTAPSPALRRSALVIMVAAITVSAFLAAAAIFVVARYPIASRAQASVEPPGSAATLAPAVGVAAPQAAEPVPAQQPAEELEMKPEGLRAAPSAGPAEAAVAPAGSASSGRSGPGL